MPSSQFIPARLLSLLIFGLVLPVYGFVSGEFIWILRGVLFGGILFVWKWRWWWNPISEYVRSGVAPTNNENGS